MNVFEALAEAQTLIYDCLINLEQDKKRNVHNLNDPGWSNVPDTQPAFIGPRKDRSGQEYGL